MPTPTLSPVRRGSLFTFMIWELLLKKAETCSEVPDSYLSWLKLHFLEELCLVISLIHSFTRASLTNDHKLHGLKKHKCILSWFWRPNVWNEGQCFLWSFCRWILPYLSKLLGYSLACDNITLISAFNLSWPSFLCFSVFSPFPSILIGFKTHPNPRWSHPEIFTLLTSAEILFPN